MKLSSIQSRFLISLGANIVRGVVTLVMTVLLARLLGSHEYGRIAFLLASFQAIRQLTDPGISSAFYTFLSQKSRSQRFVGGYWLFLIVKYLLTVAFIMWVMPQTWLAYIWRGETRDLLVFTVTAVFMQFDGWQCAAQMLESQRRTARAQAIFILFLVIQLASIYVLHSADSLTVRNYMMATSAIWISATVIAAVAYKPIETVQSSGFDKKIAQKFFSFCLPIVPPTIFSFLSDFLDRWFLQSWAGSDEQAYFSVAQQISAATLLITASMIRVLWKEIAEALHENRSDLAMQLYTRSKHALFFISTGIAGFLAPWSQEIFFLILGTSFVGAAPALVILLISAAYQTLGQIEGTLLLASEKTQTGVWLNFLMTPIGVALSYVLIAAPFGISSWSSTDAGHGAVGLALKVLATQFFSVNILGYLLCRRMNWVFEWAYQVKTLIFMALAGLGSRLIARFLGFEELTSVLLGGFIYLAMIGATLFTFPNFFQPGVSLSRHKSTLLPTTHEF
jgi:O-antigen/teichoic acid export membrane protein